VIILIKFNYMLFALHCRRPPKTSKEVVQTSMIRNSYFGWSFTNAYSPQKLAIFMEITF